MEDHIHPNCILDCPYLYQEKSIEELKQSLWLTTMELEANTVRVQEQIKARDDRLIQLKHLLNDAVNERNEARNHYQSLLRRVNHHQTTTDYGVCSSDCEERNESPVQLPPMPSNGLPENGKFLEAVKKAGPLLQNLLLAGSLPNWRQPPPPMDTCQIPSPPWVIPSQQLNISSNCCQINKKRGFSEDSVSSTETKIQRI